MNVRWFHCALCDYCFDVRAGAHMRTSHHGVRLSLSILPAAVNAREAKRYNARKAAAQGDAGVRL